MADIEKLEEQLSTIDKQLNKWTSRRTDVSSELDNLNAKLPYRNTGYSSMSGITVFMSDIKKLEGQLSKIDKNLNKCTAHRSEVSSKLEVLRANLPYRNIDRADTDASYEMLQRVRNEPRYSTLQ